MNDLARRIGRVGVLYGGVSSEREISLASGYAVGEALQRLSIENTMIDVADNLLTQLDVSNSPNIVEMRIWDSNLSELNLSGLDRLEILIANNILSLRKNHILFKRQKILI